VPRGVHHHFYPKQTPRRRIDCIYAVAVRIEVSGDFLEVRLAWWQKIVGLMGNIRVARADVSDVEVLREPVRAAMQGGIKAGLRLPWLMYVARTIRLDQAFVVRRGVPGLAFSVRNHGALRHVVLSTPEADELARRLTDGS
jgi:hypothetical protein